MLLPRYSLHSRYCIYSCVDLFQKVAARRTFVKRWLQFVCDHIKERSNQLKAEIASRLRDYDEYTANGQHVLARQSLQAIRQLSAV